MELLYKDFAHKYPFLLKEDRLEYFALFGGLEAYSLNLFNSKEAVIKDILDNHTTIESEFPFFIFDEPFRKLLISLSKSDGKVNSLLKRVGIGESLGMELVEELISSGVLYRVKTREILKEYPAQKIKKEYKNYLLEDKLFFKKPFYKFWFAFIEKYRFSEDSYNQVLKEFEKWGYKLYSLVFEQLSIELLKESFTGSDILNVGSYWDRYSEFDIYCTTSEKKYILGECKYKSRPITLSEFNKLKSKATQSGLQVDYFALFSKSGFSREFYKHNIDNLLLFDLKDFDMLI